jgi:hypothetical protein
LSLPPSPAEAVVVVAEVMVPAEIAAQIARLRSPTAEVRFRASAGKSNKTVSTSWSFTGDRWFKSISLQRRVLCEPDFLCQGPENFAKPEIKMSALP